jgi:hypothetical protein
LHPTFRIRAYHGRRLIPGSLEHLSALAGVGTAPTDVAAADRARIELELGRHLPESVAALLRHPGLETVARAYASIEVFPRSAEMASPQELPGATGSVLLLMHENQGVCSWGVSLDAGDDPPVLVGGDLEGGIGTVEFTPSVAAFVEAFVREGSNWAPEPLIQAQAAPLDADAEAFLRGRYRELARTAGWPARRNLRFEGRGVHVELWVGGEQCDWFVWSADPAALTTELAALLPLSDLRESLWAEEPVGRVLLEAARHAARASD